MANERTFLAWVRTGGVFITLSVTFTQFYYLAVKSNKVVVDDKEIDIRSLTYEVMPVFVQLGRPIAILCVLLGILLVIFGTWRYFHIQVLLTRDFFPITRITVAILVGINLGIVVTLLLLNVRITA